MTDYREKIGMLPAYMQGGMLRYIENGFEPGSFLTALLSNDLRETFARADDLNATAVRTYVQYLYSYAPQGCWGSPDCVNAWLAKGGLQARDIAA